MRPLSSLPSRTSSSLVPSLLCVVAVALGSPRDARADAPRSLTAQSEAQARFQTGLEYYDARDFESARLAFAQAYAVLQRPGILLNLALSELYAERPVDALGHLERYLAEPDLPDDKRERAKKALDEAHAKTGHLAIRVLPGTEVRVDGVPSASPVVHTMPGTRTVEAKRGERTRSVAVVAAPGETSTVDLRLGDDAPEAPGEVAADGAARPPTGPALGPDAPSSPHGAASSSFVGWRSITGMVLAGAGAAALGFGLAARGDERDAEDRVSALGAMLPSGSACSSAPSAACDELARAASERKDAGARADVLIPAGVAGAGLGLALVASALVWPHRRKSSLRVGSGPTGLGLSFVTSY